MLYLWSNYETKRLNVNWNTVKSDKDRECYLGHSVMAPTGRWQEGKDLTWYAKNRDHEQQIKSAEFRAAKKIEEDALMAALGMKVMLPPPLPPPVATSTQQKLTTKRESQSTSIKNEPMTPAIHNDSRDLKQHHKNPKHDNQRKEDRRRRRQLKATGSDEEKHDWSESDEDGLIDDIDDEEDDKGSFCVVIFFLKSNNGLSVLAKQSIEPNTMTEKELDEFLIDLVKKHGFKTIKRTLKSKKEKKEHKRQHSSSSSSSPSDSESESKHKHKKKHNHQEKSKSKKHHRTRFL
ncbi:unnamed protein product [Rotaria sp. Silwood1]|nr:unnamed protein product [Rotaria sp. Silwood1]